ncbi:MAG TPA: ATP-binding protein [Nitrospiria bacterium]|nr:ATP-binding protein [Nitrospiria bacterium]
MTDGYHAHRVHSLGGVSPYASFAVILIGFLVMVGWIFDIEVFKSGLPGLVAMNPVTAFAFILAGASLWLLGTKQADAWARRLGRACATVVFLIGLLKIGGYLFGLEIGFDQVLFREELRSQGVYPPNRIAPNTALSIFLLGSALLLLDWETPRRGHRPAHYLTLLAAVVSFLAITGYVYGVKPFYGVTSYIPMALNTAAGFIVLSVGVLFAHPDRGLMAVVTSHRPGGVMVRRLLPTMTGVLLLVGWLRLAGQREGLYETALGTALLVVVNIILLGILVWTSAKVLDRKEIERQQAEETLRRSEEKYRTLFDSVDVGVCTIEVLFDGNDKPVDYRFLEINPSFEKQTGIQNARGRRMREIAPLHEEHWFEIYGKIALTGVPARFENQAAQLHRWYDVYAFRIGEPQERKVAIHFNDITERKQAEAARSKLNTQLEAANKELEAFSYSVSHDLRAPLRHIDGFSQILLEDYNGKLDEEGQKYLQRVRGASQQMAQLIDDMLNLSRITRAEMHRGAVDLSRMAEEVAEALKKTQPERKVEIRIEQGLKAEGDERLLRVMLNNLLGNAWKYTGKRSQARIEFGRANHDSRTAYFIRDNGAGFEMTYVQKLFGAFQRLHSEMEFPGTGIGLATVKRIIHRHGGQIWAEGAVDKGATFYFTL